MPAYDMTRGEQSARLVHMDPDPRPTDRAGGHAQVAIDQIASPNASGAAIDDASIIDVLVDRLADRLAAAIVTRLSGQRDRERQDEWLDSRQAAEYLGLHRDTLRRLAAARAIPSEQDGRGCRLFFRRVALDEWRRSGGRARHLTAIADAA